MPSRYHANYLSLWGKPICGRSSENWSGKSQPHCIFLLPEWTVYTDTCHLSLFPSNYGGGKAVTLQSPYQHTLLGLFTPLQREFSPTVPPSTFIFETLHLCVSWLVLCTFTCKCSPLFYFYHGTHSAPEVVVVLVKQKWPVAWVVFCNYVFTCESGDWILTSLAWSVSLHNR